MLKMRRTIVTLLVTTLGATTAHGAQILFTPVEWAPGQVSLDITVLSGFEAVDAIDLLIGSDDMPAPFLGWTWDSPFAVEHDAIIDTGLEYYTHDVFLTANNPLPSPATVPNFRMGTLVAPDTGEYYTIQVDFDLDEMSRVAMRGEYEPFYYGGQVTIPEPATLALLGGGAIVVVWRRRPVAKSIRGPVPRP
jgi:hypothetical protein